jgi:hypothetical protein
MGLSSQRGPFPRGGPQQRISVSARALRHLIHLTSGKGYSPQLGLRRSQKFARDVLGSQGGGTPLLPAPDSARPTVRSYPVRCPRRWRSSATCPSGSWLTVRNPRGRKRNRLQRGRARARPAPRRRTPRLGRRTSGGRPSPPRPLRRASRRGRAPGSSPCTRP